MEENPKCPKCGSDQTIPILYGLPISGEAEKRGEVILGGCLLVNGSPIWHCKKCHNRWGEFKC
ncbi:MAG TPA: hypothetical protein PLO36_02945 [Methanofastidiosum sp.]|nr:hypothetical protein [Methanofastidiosum sp.]HPA49071.1 hypothetical protein [Methanofastidiosum sp.]HQK62887.1 hypothetical protein [Methanofastidiosum sp.]HQQ49252.1 hypothetical protein [Methanofastidiosum sp.]